MNNERKKVYNNLILLTISFIIILLLHFIFKSKKSSLILLLVTLINVALVPEWIKDKKMILKHKAFLIVIICILSSITLFFSYGLEKIRSYFLWIFVAIIVGTLINSISNLIKGS